MVAISGHSFVAQADAFDATGDGFGDLTPEERQLADALPDEDELDDGPICFDDRYEADACPDCGGEIDHGFCVDCGMDTQDADDDDYADAA